MKFTSHFKHGHLAERRGKKGGVDDILGIIIGQVWASQVMLVIKNLPASVGDIRDAGSVLGLGRFLEKEVTIHSSILAWKTSWTEEPGGLQSMGSQRVRHSCATHTYLLTKYIHLYYFLNFTYK